jgi:tetratricopeptide (TPR) repeat protein
MTTADTVGSPKSTIDRAVQHHLHGEFARAKALYEEVLRREPRHFNALQLLGTLAAQTGDQIRAVELLDRAIEVDPSQAAPFLNRGAILLALGRYQGALASYDRAVALVPHEPSAHFYRGKVLYELRDFARALACLDRAAALRSHDWVDVHLQRGAVLEALQQHDAALQAYLRAAEIDPRCGIAHYNSGNVHLARRDYDLALISYNKAVAIDPLHVDAHVNMGAVHKQLYQLDRALSQYDKALELRPEYAEAHFNRANVLYELRCNDQAIAAYNEAVRIRSNYDGARYNRSLALLMAGDYLAGWRDYELRWTVPDSVMAAEPRQLKQPQWRGDFSLTGRRILLVGEQGLGDTLQFCRYVSLVQELGAHVVLEVSEALRTLLKGLRGVSEVVSRGDALPEFDCVCPLMSLPLAFKTDISTIPRQVPYLSAEPSKVQVWGERLGVKRRLRVGLVWSGGFRPNQPEVWGINGRRNMALSKLAPLAHPDIEFFSLQKGQPAESELDMLLEQGWEGPEIVNVAPALVDFSDTAALVQHLDLVISVDTSSAHLVGALGKPVWILNRYDACWRWMLNREDSLWYPTARLYRQSRPGDWDSVVQEVVSGLRQLLESGRDGLPPLQDTLL